MLKVAKRSKKAHAGYGKNARYGSLNICYDFAYRSICRRECENGGTEAEHAAFGAAVATWVGRTMGKFFIIVVGAHFTDAQSVVL
jgi:hypothetical protein